MLKIRHIDKVYGRVTALKDVNLEIKKGEFFGLLGPNGAGKSTLMNIIVGYVKPDAGSVTLNDEMLAYDSFKLREKIGYVPQDISLYQELSAYQNLKIFGSVFQLEKNFLNKRIEEVLELVQLTERAKDKVKTFSGGMKRRLNLAASILHNPEIILCDEPTVGVDPQSRNAIFDMLKALNNEGKTILYTTHYMEEAERLCSRIGVIDNGNIIAMGNLNELIELLDKKESIKIVKNSITEKVADSLNDLGKLIKMDYYYELIVNDEFLPYSKLFSFLEEKGIPTGNVTLSRASLEDVFLFLTGRRLRD